MKWLLLRIFDHPVLAAALVALGTLGFALQLPRLEIDPSAEGMMVANDPARTFYEQAKGKFGSDTLTVVVVKAEDVFAAPVLRAIKRISDGLERTDGVTRVESLTTVRNLKGEGNTLKTDLLVEGDIPSDGAQLRRVREEALGSRLISGSLVASDGRTAAIVAYTEAKGRGKDFHQRFVDRVDGLIQEAWTPRVTFYQIGDSLMKVTYWQFTRRDQFTLIPLSIATLFLVLLVAFRTPQGVVIPVVTGVVSIVWAAGLMALVGLPLTALTSLVPSLMIAIGFTEDVHMIAEYHRLLREGQDKRTAIRTMLEQTALPLLVTTGTTVLGFLSLLTTDITMLVQFGAATSMGIAANFVITMLLVPMMLRVWPVPRRLQHLALHDGRAYGLIHRLLDWLADFVPRHRLAIGVATGLLVVGSLAGWCGLRVDTDYLSYFPERSVVRERAKDLQRSLAGGLDFYVVVETGRADGVKDPKLLRAIAGLQDYLAETGRVDKTLSVADYLRRMHREMHGGDPRLETIPGAADEVAQYLLLLEGKELAKYVDFDASTANIVVRHHITSSWELGDLRRRIDAYVAAHFPRSATVRVTGESILVHDASDYMAINEFTSFITTLLIIGLVHAGLFMSLRAGLLSLVPNVIPILANFGLMGLLGIPLNTGTAVVGTLALGIAVDDTVHHMMAYKRELAKDPDAKLAVRNIMKSQGRPVIYVSLALAAGFFVLTFSNFVQNIHVGFLSGVVMLVAMVGELVLTPILMLSARRVTAWDSLLRRMPLGAARGAPLFQGLSRWQARRMVRLGSLKALDPGQYAVRKGEAETEMYMVLRGRLRVFDRAPDGREPTVAFLGPGMVFGAAAGVGAGVRRAHVVAESPSEVLVLNHHALERIRKSFPITGTKLLQKNVEAILAERLRSTTYAFLQARPSAIAPPPAYASARVVPRFGAGGSPLGRWA